MTETHFTVPKIHLNTKCIPAYHITTKIRLEITF